MIKKFNLWRERHAHKVYVRLNKRRKSAEPTIALYRFFDDLRRRTGYVK